MENSKELAADFKKKEDEKERVAKAMAEIAPILEKHSVTLQIQQNIVFIPLDLNREDRRELKKK